MSQTNLTNATGPVRIFDADEVRRALRRIAHEIIERNRDLPALILAGIPARGVELARRIASDIEAIEKVRIPTGVIDVSMHRDDFGRRASLPVVRASELPLPLEKRTVRSFHRPDLSRRDGRARLLRSARVHPVCRLDRSRSSRAADPTRLCREKSSDRAGRACARAPGECG